MNNKFISTKSKIRYFILTEPNFIFDLEIKNPNIKKGRANKTAFFKKIIENKRDMLKINICELRLNCASKIKEALRNISTLMLHNGPFTGGSNKS